MYILLFVQLFFFTATAFLLSRLLKLKRSLDGENLLKTHFGAESLLDLFIPSFVGAYGIWFPEFWLLRNCIRLAFHHGKLLVSFDPVTFVLDLFTQSDSKTKAIEDAAESDMTLLEVTVKRAKAFATRFVEKINKSSSAVVSTGSADLKVFKKDLSAVDSKIAGSIESSSSAVAQSAKSAEKVVVKVVVAVNSRWTTYRFRVPKFDFSFNELTSLIEERWAKEKKRVAAITPQVSLGDWRMKYQDDEREWVTIGNQSEWEEAIRVGSDMVRLHVNCA